MATFNENYNTSFTPDVSLGKEVDSSKSASLSLGASKTILIKKNSSAALSLGASAEARITALVLEPGVYEDPDRLYVAGTEYTNYNAVVSSFFGGSISYHIGARFTADRSESVTELYFQLQGTTGGTFRLHLLDNSNLPTGANCVPDINVAYSLGYKDIVWTGGWAKVVLDTPVALTKGNVYILAAEHKSGTNASTRVVRTQQDLIHSNNNPDAQHSTMYANGSSGNWSPYDAMPGFGMKFAGGDYFGGNINGNGYANITSTINRAQRYIPPVSVVVNTIRRNTASTNVPAYEIRDADQNVLRSGTMPFGSGIKEATLSSPLQLIGGQEYYIVIWSTGSTITFYGAKFDDDGGDPDISQLSPAGAVTMSSADSGVTWTPLAGRNMWLELGPLANSGMSLGAAETKAIEKELSSSFGMSAYRIRSLDLSAEINLSASKAKAIEILEGAEFTIEYLGRLVTSFISTGLSLAAEKAPSAVVKVVSAGITSAANTTKDIIKKAFPVTVTLSSSDPTVTYTREFGASISLGASISIVVMKDLGVSLNLSASEEEANQNTLSAGVEIIADIIKRIDIALATNIGLSASEEDEADKQETLSTALTLVSDRDNRTHKLLEIIAGGGGGIDLGDELVSHFKFNDNAANTNVLDSISASNATAFANTSTITAAGKINETLDLTGDGENIVVSDVDDIKPATIAYTISLWFKIPNALPQQEIWLYTAGWAGGDWSAILIDHQAEFTYINHQLEVGANTFSMDCDTFVTLADGNWHHLVIVVDSTQGASPIYLDNVDISANYTNWGLTGSPNFATIGDITFGAPEGGLNGGVSLDDFRFYDKALSTEEVAAIYNSGNGTESEGVVLGAVLGQSTVGPITLGASMAAMITKNFSATVNLSSEGDPDVKVKTLNASLQLASTEMSKQIDKEIAFTLSLSASEEQDAAKSETLNTSTTIVSDIIKYIKKILAITAGGGAIALGADSDKFTKKILFINGVDMVPSLELLRLRVGDVSVTLGASIEVIIIKELGATVQIDAIGASFGFEADPDPIILSSSYSRLMEYRKIKSAGPIALYPTTTKAITKELGASLSMSAFYQGGKQYTANAGLILGASQTKFIKKDLSVTVGISAYGSRFGLTGAAEATLTAALSSNEKYNKEISGSPGPVIVNDAFYSIPFTGSYRPEFEFECPAGTNYLLILCTTNSGFHHYPAPAEYDGVAMDIILTNLTHSSSISIWGMANPSIGTHTYDMQWNGGSGRTLRVTAIALSHCAGYGGQVRGDTVNNLDITPTGAQGMIFDVICTGSPEAPGSGQTVINLTTLHGTSYKPYTGTEQVTMSWIGASPDYPYVLVDMKGLVAPIGITAAAEQTKYTKKTLFINGVDMVPSFEWLWNKQLAASTTLGASMSVAIKKNLNVNIDLDPDAEVTHSGEANVNIALSADARALLARQLDTSFVLAADVKKDVKKLFEYITVETAPTIVAENGYTDLIVNETKSIPITNPGADKLYVIVGHNAYIQLSTPLKWNGVTLPLILNGAWGGSTSIKVYELDNPDVGTYNLTWWQSQTNNHVYMVYAVFVNNTDGIGDYVISGTGDGATLIRTLTARERSKSILLGAGYGYGSGGNADVDPVAPAVEAASYSTEHGINPNGDVWASKDFTEDQDTIDYTISGSPGWFDWNNVGIFEILSKIEQVPIGVNLSGDPEVASEYSGEVSISLVASMTVLVKKVVSSNIDLSTGMTREINGVANVEVPLLADSIKFIKSRLEYTYRPLIEITSISVDYRSISPYRNSTPAVWAHTCTADDDILVLTVGCAQGAEMWAGYPKYGSTPMVLAASVVQAANTRNYIYYLLNPTPGTQNLTWTSLYQGYAPCMAQGISMKNVDMSNPVGAIGTVSGNQVTIVPQGKHGIILDAAYQQDSSNVGSITPYSGQITTNDYFDSTKWLNAASKFAHSGSQRIMGWTRSTGSGEAWSGVMAAVEIVSELEQIPIQTILGADKDARSIRTFETGITLAGSDAGKQIYALAEVDINISTKVNKLFSGVANVEIDMTYKNAPGPESQTDYSQTSLAYTHFYISSSYWDGQQFEAQKEWITSIDININNHVTQNLTFSIYAADGANKPTGPALSSIVHSSTDLSAADSVFRWAYGVALTPTKLTIGQKYMLVISGSAAGGSNNTDVNTQSPGTYPDGGFVYSSNSGSTWLTDDIAKDMAMVMYGADNAPAADAIKHIEKAPMEGSLSLTTAGELVGLILNAGLTLKPSWCEDIVTPVLWLRACMGWRRHRGMTSTMTLGADMTVFVKKTGLNATISLIGGETKHIEGETNVTLYLTASETKREGQLCEATLYLTSSEHQKEGELNEVTITLGASVTIFVKKNAGAIIILQGDPHKRIYGYAYVTITLIPDPIKRVTLIPKGAELILSTTTPKIKLYRFVYGNESEDHAATYDDQDGISSDAASGDGERA